MRNEGCVEIGREKAVPGMFTHDSYARPLIHMCAQPIVWFERERKLRAGHSAGTRQTCNQSNETSEGSGEPVAQDVTLMAKGDLEHEQPPIQERSWSILPCSRDLPR